MNNDVVLSPSQLSLWLEDEEAYYKRYVHKVRGVQLKVMSVGSAFDSYVKAKLLHGGDNEARAAYFEKQFTTSVEPQNRDWARNAGADCFIKYLDSGAFDCLNRELYGKVVRCEERQIVEVDGVHLNCVADLFVEGDIVHDWKVNGYLSTGKPGKGYKRMWKDGVDKSKEEHDESWCTGRHKVDSSWYIQLETYALIHNAKEIWLDQLIFPGPRIAQYRWHVDCELGVIQQYRELQDRWKQFRETGQFLKDMDRQKALDAANKVQVPDWLVQ